MKVKTLVREYFPKADNHLVEFILWEKTGWPCFWRAEDGNTPEECLRAQLKRYRHAYQMRLWRLKRSRCCHD